MKITSTIALSERHLDRIRKVSSDINFVVAKSLEEQEASLPGTDVIFGRFTPEMLTLAKDVKWIQAPFVGADSLLASEFVNSPIPLVNARGTMGIPMAEHAWALILALTRGIGNAIRKGGWENRGANRLQVWELAGMTMGIVGLGSSGTEVARRAAAFGMEVIATKKRDAEIPPFVSKVWKPDRLHDLLALSDIVVICTPLTDQTRGMFDLAAFQRMRRHALLINVARGQIVQENALLQALGENLIGGAGLDVVPTEPLPNDSPLWGMENVVLTQHMAGNSPVSMDRIVDLLCTNLMRFAAGQPLLNVVNKREGY